MFYEDFRRVAAPFGQAAPGDVRLELRHGVFLAASDLDRLVTALEGIDESAVGFRRTCAGSEPGRMKRHGAALRTHCEQIDAEMRRGVAPSPV